MLRILSIVLIISAIALTFILGGDFGITDWTIYAPALGLTLVIILLWIIISVSNSNRRKDKSKARSEVSKETLEDLGILEINPMPSSQLNDDLYPDPLKNKPPESDSPISVQLSLLQESDLQDPPASIAFEKSYDPHNKNFAVPILQGFRTALNAHAVGIIQEMGNYEYKILGNVGQDWIRSRGDVFVLKYDMLEESQHTAILPLRSDGLQSNHLTYSRKPASVTALGISTIGGTGIYLLVDSIEEGGFKHPRALKLLEVFGRTYELLLYKDDPNRPRHEIISEEMSIARENNHELALALVIPQRAELLIKTYADFIDDIEDELEKCLNRATKKGRVIKFGELLFGVFTNGNKNSLELWHQRMQHEIKTHGGLLTGGVFVGIAIMKKEYKTADDFRNDARRALVEAYQGTNETVII